MAFQKAVAQKNGDGSYTVRVIHSQGISTDVWFPYDSENERLAIEYANFKNAQLISGPESPATAAVVADLLSQKPGDLHEQLMAAALTDTGKPVATPEAEKPAAVVVGVDLASGPEKVVVRTEDPGINPTGEQGTSRVPIADVE